MHIIPVLDLKQGCVVRGVAGRRSEYRPIESRLVNSAEPVAVTRVLQSLGLSQFYIADLDAIGGAEPSWDIYRVLSECGIKLWIDAGITNATQAERMFDFAETERNVTGIIAGLESLAGPETLAEIVGQDSADRLIFSLDLKNGRPLANGNWKDATAENIAPTAIIFGVRRMIVLDLAGVGVGEGVVALDLCRRLREQFADLEIISGGGVRDAEDLSELEAAGCDAALVASALHDGRITRETLDRWHRTHK